MTCRDDTSARGACRRASRPTTSFFRTDEPADAPNDWSAQQPPALKALCEELLTVDAAARPTMSVATDRLRAILAAAEAGEPHVAAAPAGVHVELPAMRPPAQEAPPDEEAEILANRE